jgi:hypothetical protein
LLNSRLIFSIRVRASFALVATTAIAVNVSTNNGCLPVREQFP